MRIVILLLSSLCALMSYAHAGCHGCCHGHSWTSVADSTSGALVDNFWNVDKGFFNLRSNENESSGINYWPQAHAMDVVVDAYVRTGDSRYAAMFDKWFEGIKLQNGEGSGYQNDFYDDEAWVALTMTRLYNVSQDKIYSEPSEFLLDTRCKHHDRNCQQRPIADFKFGYLFHFHSFAAKQC